MAFIKPARRANWNGKHCCTVTSGHAAEFFRRHAVARADETVEAIAAFRGVNVSIRENRDGLCGIVKRRIEVREIVGLRVDRLTKLVTHAELEAQLAINFPTVCNKRLGLRETEKAHRIESLLAVRAEVSEQSIGE